MFQCTYRSGVIKIAVLFCACLGTASAIPDAGQLSRDNIPQKAYQDPVAKKTLAEPVGNAPVDGGTKVKVREFRFSGFEKLISENELRRVVDPWTGRALTMAELNKAVSQVTELLRNKGFLLSRAYLPQQEVTNGTVEIAVIQAQSDGGVGIKPMAGSRLSEATIRGLVANSIQPGKALRDRDLEEALMLINTLPGVQARAILEQGAAAGSTHVSIEANEGPLLEGLLWGDNYGNRYSGAWRGNGLLVLNDLTGRGDTASFLASGSSDLQQGRVLYSTPVGSKGLKTGVSFTAMRYELGKEISALDASGNSLTLNAWGSLPLVLLKAKGVSVTAGYEHKRLADKALDVTLHRRFLNSGSLGLTGYFRDGFGGGGYTSWSVSGTIGDADYSRVETDELIDRSTAGAAGGYARANLTLSRQQRLSDDWSLLFSCYGQLSLGNLDSSEKLSLGGPYSLRAYPVGEASADDGLMGSLELSHMLCTSLKKTTVQLFAFVDAGRVCLHHDLWTGAVDTATGHNSYGLAGAGAGVNVTLARSLSLRVCYAQQLGGNQGRSVSGNNSDGRSDSGRLWIAAQYSF
jgi:hemolysin activation/secretion protein